MFLRNNGEEGYSKISSIIIEEEKQAMYLNPYTACFSNIQVF